MGQVQFGATAKGHIKVLPVQMKLIQFDTWVRLAWDEKGDGWHTHTWQTFDIDVTFDSDVSLHTVTYHYISVRLPSM